MGDVEGAVLTSMPTRYGVLSAPPRVRIELRTPFPCRLSIIHRQQCLQHYLRACSRIISVAKPWGYETLLTPCTTAHLYNRLACDQPGHGRCTAM